MEYSDAHKQIERLKAITRYGITGLGLLLTAHCGLLFFGYDVFIVHVVACIFALILGISLSRTFGMCLIHRLCVAYVCTVLLCIVIRRHGIFGNETILTWSRLVMFIIGILLQIMVLCKARKKN